MDLLHAGSLAGCAVAAGSAALTRQRDHRREIALAVVMVAAMVDALVAGGIPVVYWSITIAVLAIVTMVRSDARTAATAVRVRRAVSAVGSILMATLMLFMDSTGAAPTAGQHHSGSPSAVVAGLALLAVACAAIWIALLVKRRARVWLHDAGMALSLLLMAGASGAVALGWS